MDPSRLMTSTATVTWVTGSGTVDEMGNPADVVDSDSYPCWLWQTSRSETTAGTDVQRETFELGLHPDAASIIDSVDAIAVDGVAYEFVGPPWAAKNPRSGTVSHIEATVRRTR